MDAPKPAQSCAEGPKSTVSWCPDWECSGTKSVPGDICTQSSGWTCCDQGRSECDGSPCWFETDSLPDGEACSPQQQQVPNIIMDSARFISPAAKLSLENFFMKINMHDYEKYGRGAEGGADLTRSFWEAAGYWAWQATMLLCQICRQTIAVLTFLYDTALAVATHGRALAEPDETKMLPAPH